MSKSFVSLAKLIYYVTVLETITPFGDTRPDFWFANVPACIFLLQRGYPRAIFFLRAEHKGGVAVTKIQADKETYNNNLRVYAY